MPVEFSPTEVKVIKLICKQNTSREIGEQLGLSFRTIEDYRHRIQQKMNAKNAVGIAIYAMRKGIVK